MLTQVFKSILLISAVGSLLSLFLLCVKPITRKIFSPRWQYYIWLTVLIVMILPVRFSVPSHTTNIPTAIINQSKNIETEISQTDSQTAEVKVSEQTEEISIRKIELPQNIFYHLANVWLLGMIAVLLTKIAKYNLFLRAIHKNSEIETRITNVPKRLKVRKTDMLDAPLIVGIFKPTLLLPETEIAENDMRYILMHELTHYKRGDILYKWFAMIVLSIHWFNPFVYIVSRQIDTECEVSCDFAVTSKLSDNEKKSYMSMILTLLSNSESGLRPLTTQMASGKITIKRRFAMIKKSFKISKKVAIISTILAVIIFVAGIFASGIIRANLFDSVNNSTISLNTDERHGNGFNMLFVGVDNGGRADTIMLLKFEKDGINCISIPRNTIVENKRVSDIFAAENGNQAVIDTVKKNLSVPVHYYTEINLSAVKEIVDNVGGIDFDVPMDMNYDDPYQDVHINLKKGMQRLNGEDVCGLLQFRRGYTEGDLSRIQLHQQFLDEFILQKLHKENIDKIPEIVDIISNNIKTNYSMNNFRKDIKIIKSINNIKFETIPGKITVYENMPVYVIKKSV